MHAHNRIWASLAALAILTLAVPKLSPGQPASSSSHGDEPARSCSDLHIRFEHGPAVVESEQQTITKTETPTLRVQAEYNGGVQVVGWDNDTYGVTLCKAAASGGNAEEILSEIHLTLQNGKLGVSGPSSHSRWTAHLLVNAPRAASLDVAVNNGPLSLIGVDGNVRVRAENGPITVASSTGNLELNAQNGPVDLEGNSGKLNVQAQNGPVTLSLNGKNWNGSGVEAHANNGPLTLRIPTGYQSGVLVESDGNSPFDCHASACSEARKSWDENRKSIQFGSGPTMIHLTTLNGPISIN